MYRLLGTYVGKTLKKCAKPARFAGPATDSIELLSSQDRTGLGLTIPPSILDRPTQVIE